ncbi:MAG: hypothetical protein DRO40_02110 [Thermoprotei archaeon]|nr:MAG: hypothetical protein DRO40_02110 [Thermoprotei archaeon]
MFKILCKLSKERPVFHSEADFQHALAWKIHEMYNKEGHGIKVRLEKKIKVDNNPIYVDIFLEDNEGNKWIVELKYKTRALCVEVDGEEYDLKNQGAHYTSRYDFIKDLSRLEKCVRAFTKTTGYAIFLTNDPQYWNKPRKDSPKDKDFRIHEGRILEGTLRWAENTLEGTRRGREEDITLNGKYKLKWNEWKEHPALKEKEYGIFKYLLIVVK